MDEHEVSLTAVAFDEIVDDQHGLETFLATNAFRINLEGRKAIVCTATPSDMSVDLEAALILGLHKDGNVILTEALQQRNICVIAIMPSANELGGILGLMSKTRVLFGEQPAIMITAIPERLGVVGSDIVHQMIGKVGLNNIGAIKRIHVGLTFCTSINASGRDPVPQRAVAVVLGERVSPHCLSLYFQEWSWPPKPLLELPLPRTISLFLTLCADWVLLRSELAQFLGTLKPPKPWPGPFIAMKRKLETLSGRGWQIT